MSIRVDSRTRSRALPCLAVVGASGSGKTTLLERVVPLLAAAGVRVSLIKHAHCGVQFDTPGKDSHRLKAAGAAEVLVASAGGYAIVGDAPALDTEPRLAWLVSRLDRTACDLVLAEGFAHERGVPKLEVVRPHLGRAPRCWPDDPDLLAIASDAALTVAPPVQLLHLDDHAAVAAFLRDFAAAGSARELPECA